MLQAELYIVVFVILILFGLLSIIFIYLVIQKGIANQKRRRIDKYKELVSKAMFQFLYQNVDSRLLLPDNPVKFQALEEVLSDYAKILDGEQALNRISSFANDHFYGYYRERLFHRRWSIRMNTMYMIEDFRMKKLLPDLTKLYDSNKITIAEETQILKLLALFNESKIVEKIKHPKNQLSEFTIRTILGKLNEESFQSLVVIFEYLPKPLQYSIIDVIGVQNLNQYHSYLKNLLKSKDAEIRIRSLKAISALGYPLSSEEIKSHLDSIQWQERMMAAKVCGVLKDRNCLDELKKLMKDKHFLVRTQAAQSILQLPNGRAVLKEIAENSDDSFAKDMALEWLERGEL